MDGKLLADVLHDVTRRDFLRRAGGAAAMAALLGGGVEALAGCASAGSGQPQASATPRRGGHVTELWQSDFSTFNPFNFLSTLDQIMAGFVFDSLLTTQPDGTLVPLLATGLPSVSSDGLTYTFKLKDGVRWTDGRPVTGDDVVFSYRLLYDPQYAAFSSSLRGEVSAHLKSVTSPDPRTVVFTMKSVFAPFVVSYCQYGILPRHVLEGMSAAQLNTAEFFRAPTVGSGLFLFEKWDRGAQLSLKRNPNYHRGPALLDRYVFRVVGSTQAIATSLKTGEGDFGAIDPAFYTELQSVPNLRIHTLDIALYFWFMFNLNPSGPAGTMFTDRRVRQALTYAMDRQRIANSVFFTLATVPDSALPPSSWAHKANVTPRYGFDPKKAARLLDEAGWKKGPDGIRAKDGVKMQFEVMVNNNNVRINAVSAVQQQWRDIGVAFTPKVVEGNEWVQQIRTKREFKVLLSGSQLGQDPDQSNLWGSRNVVPGGANGGHYMNPDLDKVLDEAVGTLDRAKRKQLYARMQDILAEDVPAAPLVSQKYAWGVNKRVQGFTIGAYSQWGQRPWFKDVYVSDAK
jgi:peptide/nickel transport system substrate-binding protein